MSLKTKRGLSFVKWVVNSIDNGTLTYNEKKSMLHCVGEQKSIFLASPNIFKAFMSDPDNAELLKELELTSTQIPRLQKGFLSLQMHDGTDSLNKSLMQIYSVNTDKPLLKGLLVSNWSMFFLAEPEQSVFATLQPSYKLVEGCNDPLLLKCGKVFFNWLADSLAKGMVQTEMQGANIEFKFGNSIAYLKTPDIFYKFITDSKNEQILNELDLDIGDVEKIKLGFHSICLSDNEIKNTHCKLTLVD